MQVLRRVLIAWTGLALLALVVLGAVDGIIARADYADEMAPWEHWNKIYEMPPRDRIEAWRDRTLPIAFRFAAR